MRSRRDVLYFCVGGRCFVTCGSAAAFRLPLGLVVVVFVRTRSKDRLVEDEKGVKAGENSRSEHIMCLR